MFILTILITATLHPSCSAAFSSTTKEWSNTAIETAKSLSISQRSRLHDTGVTNIKRPIQITARRITTAEDCLASSSPDEKIVHLQRHGQGYHNLIGDIFRDCGNTIDLNDPNPKTNPFVRSEIIDSPLTELGRRQSSARRMEASLLSPEVIIVSPLQRAIQTAFLSFADHRAGAAAEKKKVPFVAHEGCREELGLLACNKLRRLSEIQRDYPDVDFSYCGGSGGAAAAAAAAAAEDEDDALWLPDKRESPKDQAERVYKFLTEFVRLRPETEMALVGHSAWLFNMLNAVVDCGEDEELASWFLTSEIRSVKLSFTDTTD